MSSNPRRPSTLAARNFEAAQRGMAALTDAPAAPRPADSRAAGGVMMGVGRSSVAQVPTVSSRLVSSRPVSSVPMRTRPAPPAPPAHATTVRGAARPDVAVRASEPAPPAKATLRRIEAAQRDQVIVTSVIVAFIFVAIAIATVQMRGRLKQDRSRQAISATFTKVFERQGTFRLLNGRFATWGELERRGATVGPRQQVVGSNASASHWFLAVRDTTTGIICSRTGELFDESPLERQPTCTTGRR